MIGVWTELKEGFLLCLDLFCAVSCVLFAFLCLMWRKKKCPSPADVDVFQIPNQLPIWKMSSSSFPKSVLNNDWLPSKLEGREGELLDFSPPRMCVRGGRKEKERRAIGLWFVQSDLFSSEARSLQRQEIRDM